MIAFNPRDFKEDLYSPSVCITPIDVQEDRIGAPKYNVNQIMKNGELKLPHNRSTFTLSYVALSYTSPDAIQYAYRLEGSDKDWIYMKQNKDVTFANLSPGDYVFRVKSTNSSGVWQDNETTLRITVTPPFWATGWALLIYFTILCLLIVLWYNYKKAKLEEKHRINREIFESKKEKELYNAKIQFFTFITHEIRTPHTLIKAPLEKILRSGDGTPATQENLRIIEKNTGRLLDLSNQLLDFRKTESRGFKLNYVKTDVVLWLETILHPFRPAFEQGNKNFTVKLPDLPFEACLDREAFSKIVSNLVSNALKYSDSRISLELLPPSGEERMFTLLVTNDRHLIPDSEIENIFNPFYRLKETENQLGRGIGLSLAHSLKEFHCGRLFYRQTPDGLNQFVLMLPEQQEDSFQTSAGKENSELVTLAETGKSVILIVEDQNDMRHFIARELAETYQVLEAENGKVALDLVRKNTVNLIISDVMMPVMDGLEMVKQIKENSAICHIPIIILSAKASLDDRIAGLEQGIDDYITKPFSATYLKTRIITLLRQRKSLQEMYMAQLTDSKNACISSGLTQSQPQITPYDEKFMQKVMEFMETQMDNSELTIDAFAEHLMLSRTIFYRKLKSIIGLTAVDFIREIRIKRAVQLIDSGEYNFSQIAYMTGFSDPKYFSKCFKKVMGVTPTEYKEK